MRISCADERGPSRECELRVAFAKVPLAFAQRFLGLMTLDDISSLSHIKVEQAQVLLGGLMHWTKMRRQRA